MTLAPLLDASVAIQIHVLFAISAVILGPLAMLRKSRDIWHRRLGQAWVVAMLVVSLSSFLIQEARTIGPFSVIHGLSVLTLVGLWQAVAAARAGRIAAHRAGMLGLYVYAIGIAGLFTLLPDRRMSAVLFPETPWTGFIATAIVLALAGLGLNLAMARQGPQPR